MGEGNQSEAVGPLADASNEANGAERLVPLDALGVAALQIRDGQVVAVNPAAADLFGIAAGQSVRKAFPESERSAVDQLLAEGGTTTVRLATGVDLRAVELHLTARGPDRIMLAHDVTEARRYAAVVSAVGDATTLMASDGRAYWGRPFPRNGPLGIGDVTGEQLLAWSHPEDLPVILDLFSRALAEPGLRATWESRWRYPEQDTWIWSRFVGFSGFADPDLGGIVVLQIDERVEARSLAGEHDPALLSLAEAAPVGILVADVNGHVVYRNPLAREYLGPSDQNPDTWVDCALDEHREALRDLWAAALAGLEGRAVVGFRCCGSVPLWLQVTVVPQRSASGELTGVNAALQDVTDAVTARREVDRMLHVLDTGSDCVVIAAPDATIVQVNNAARRRLGLDPDEDTRSLRELLSDASRAAFDESVLPTLTAFGSWIGELELIADDVPLPVSIVAVAEFVAGEVESLAFVARDISLLKATEEKLRRAATHDHLTGLPNRTLLFERLQAALALHRRHGNPAALLFCDLDGFKDVNDNLGHDAGDLVLRVAADRLRHAVRASDTVARIGGDEFVVLCEQFDHPDDLTVVADRIVEAVSEPIDVGWDSARVGVSVGIAIAGPGVDEADALLSKADAAMYEAKRRGRGPATTMTG